MRKRLCAQVNSSWEIENTLGTGQMEPEISLGQIIKAVAAQYAASSNLQGTMENFS